MPKKRASAPPAGAAPRTSAAPQLPTIGDVRLRRKSGERAFFYAAGMTIDTAGSPRAYHPRGSPPGLDHLKNAGSPGNWWALVTDPNGEPVVQRRGDPAPGFYISTTALEDASQPATSPRRYVNSSTIPFVVLPQRVLEATGARLGDFAAVWNRRTEKVAYAIVADIGPAGRIGEGSIALARALAIDPSPTSGGQSADVVYVIFPGSGNRRPRTRPEIRTQGAALFEKWGGTARARVRPNDGAPLFGLYRAIVTDIVDPSSLGRIQVSLPSLGSEGTEVRAWANLIAPYADDDQGYEMLPEVGTQVVVGFEAGDPARPYVVGATWNGSKALPEAATAANNKRLIKSRSGSLLEFDDTQGSAKVTVSMQSGHKLVLNDASQEITLLHSNGCSIVLTAAGQIQISANSTVELTASALNVHAPVANFDGLINCTTIVCSSGVVSPSYTPGAGNIW